MTHAIRAANVAALPCLVLPFGLDVKDGVKVDQITATRLTFLLRGDGQLVRAPATGLATASFHQDYEWCPKRRYHVGNGRGTFVTMWVPELPGMVSLNWLGQVEGNIPFLPPKTYTFSNRPPQKDAAILRHPFAELELTCLPFPTKQLRSGEVLGLASRAMQMEVLFFSKDFLSPPPMIQAMMKCDDQGRWQWAPTALPAAQSMVKKKQMVFGVLCKRCGEFEKNMTEEPSELAKAVEEDIG